MGRRRRCSSCNALTEPARLAKVGGRRALCPDCLVAEADRLAPAELDLGNSDPKDSDSDSVAPEPLPLRDEEERFEGLMEYDVAGWPLRRGRLSASALATFWRCPEQFRRQYVLGEKRPSGGTGLAGTGAHGAIEAAHRFKSEHGLIATPKQIADTFDAVYEGAVARAADREGIAWGKADKVALDYDSARALGQAAVKGYAESPGFVNSRAVAVEHVFAFTIPGVAVPFCGLIDVVTEQGVIDLKFGAQTASVIKPDWRLQALVYGFAQRSSPEFHATSWAGKAQSPATHPGLRWPWDPIQTILAANQMRKTVEAILAYAERWPDTEWPGNLSHQWACNLCEFRPDCAWWNVPDSELLL